MANSTLFSRPSFRLLIVTPSWLSCASSNASSHCAWHPLGDRPNVERTLVNANGDLRGLGAAAEGVVLSPRLELLWRMQLGGQLLHEVSLSTLSPSFPKCAIRTLTLAAGFAVGLRLLIGVVLRPRRRALGVVPR